MKHFKHYLAFVTAMLCSIGLNAQGLVFSGPSNCNEAANTSTWTVPNWLTSITVDVYGGGGAGGGSGGGNSGGFYEVRAGGGGGAGGYSSMTINVIPGTVFSYSAAPGGCGGDPGGDPNNGYPGTDGGVSTFSGTDANGQSIMITANGGSGGTAGEGTNGSAGLGGAGGSASGGTTNTAGTAGTDGTEDTQGIGGNSAGPSAGLGGTIAGQDGANFGGGGAGGSNSRGGHGAPGAILISGPLHVSNDAQQLGISLQPNPATSQTQLQFTVAQTDQFQIVLMNITGKAIHTIYKGVLNAGKQHFELGSKLPLAAGTYLIQVHNSNITSTSKLVVN